MTTQQNLNLRVTINFHKICNSSSLLCNEPPPRAGSFASSTVLLAHSPLNGNGLVLTGGFPFLFRFALS
ncbi:hypothetical protein T03_3041 [Trichinella britovi]|uniref:Uncharacterized protein n=1 Tax=Trichinella britovi TaxID=45882 RepID=A0A0V1CWF8_TRIBR|nr:hypothetical protein T03_3041 [Trichinella britovi]